jgi:hypothetical protein
MAAGAVGALVLLIAAASARASGVTLLALVFGYLIACPLWTTLGIAGILGQVVGAFIPAAVGVGVFVAVDRAIVGSTGAHLVIAASVALVVALSLGLLVVRHAFGHVVSTPAPGAVRRTIDPRDGASYFFCGLFSLTPIFAPHLLAWSGRADGSAQWGHGVLALEVALVVALLPVVASVGVADRELRGFWRLLGTALERTMAGKEKALAAELQASVRRGQRRYVWVLSILALATSGLFALIASAGWLDQGLGRDQVGWAVIAVVVASIAYVFLGLGVFSSMYSLSLGAPLGVLKALGAAMASVGVVGYPLARLWSWRAALPALVVATAVFALMAARSQRAVVRKTAHLYSAVS